MWYIYKCLLTASVAAQEELEATGGVLTLEAQGETVAEAAAGPVAAAKFEADPTPEQVSLAWIASPHSCSL